MTPTNVFSIFNYSMYIQFYSMFITLLFLLVNITMRYYKPAAKAKIRSEQLVKTAVFVQQKRKLPFKGSRQGLPISDRIDRLFI